MLRNQHKMAAKSGVCNCKKAGTNTLLRKIQQGTLPEEAEQSIIVVSLPIGCVYCSGSHGDGPLLVAARYGHLDIVKTLSEKYGSPLEMGNNDGKRPLHEAAQNGHTECARYLISRGARIDALKQADWWVPVARIALLQRLHIIPLTLRPTVIRVVCIV